MKSKYVIIALAVILVIGFAGYYYFVWKQGKDLRDIVEFIEQLRQPVDTLREPQIELTPEDVGIAGETTNFKIYKNLKYGFEITYPPILQIKEGKIEPNTYYVLWENPEYENAKVNIVYINDGKSALTQEELSKGAITKVGGKDAWKFTLNNNPLYWVDLDNFALAIYFEKPQGSGSDYNNYINLSSFKF